MAAQPRHARSLVGLRYSGPRQSGQTLGDADGEYQSACLHGFRDSQRILAVWYHGIQRMRNSRSHALFNAGVILVNLRFWRSHGVEDKYLSYLQADGSKDLVLGSGSVECHHSRSLGKADGQLELTTRPVTEV